MRVSADQMAENHRKIVESTAFLIRERGISGVSVSDAMSAANLTHGGFYRHFKDKEELVTEALSYAFEQFLAPLEQQLESDPDTARVVHQFFRSYLSNEHVGNPGLGCPMTSLAPDLSRGSESAREIFTAGFKRLVNTLSTAERRGSSDLEAAYQIVAMLVGAVVVARVVDPPTGGAVLKACRKALK